MKIEWENDLWNWVKYKWKHEEQGMAIGQHKSQQWHLCNSAATNQNCSVLGKAIEMFSLAVAQWNSKLANELQSSEFLKP